MLEGDTPIDAVHRLLVAAIESADHSYDSEDPELINALWILALVCYFGGRGELWAPLHSSIARLSPAPPPLLSLTIDMFADPARTGVAALPRLRAALDVVHDEVDIANVQNLAGAAMYADLLAEIREPLWRTVRQGRLGGPGRRYLVALMDLCVDDFHRGTWDEAADLAAEGLALSQNRGSTFFAWYFHYHRALLAAVQGRPADAREIAQQIIGWAEPRGVGTARVYAHHALVLADLAAGEHALAYQHAIEISPPGVLPSHVPHALWIVMDLVEAAVRSGRQADAERHVQALRDADIAALSPRLALLEAGASGIAAAGAAARAHFERALALPAIDRWPFDLARVKLAYGEQLRLDPGHNGREGSADRRTHDVRTPRRTSVGGPCPERAAGHGCPPEREAVGRFPTADGSTAPDRPAGRVRPDEQADRRTAVPLTEDGRRSPVPDLPQARRDDARCASRCPGRRRRRCPNLNGALPRSASTVGTWRRQAGTTYGNVPLRRWADTSAFSPDGTAVFVTRESMASGALSASDRPLRPANPKLDGDPTT